MWTPRKIVPEGSITTVSFQHNFMVQRADATLLDAATHDTIKNMPCIASASQNGQMQDVYAADIPEPDSPRLSSFIPTLTPTSSGPHASSFNCSQFAPVEWCSLQTDRRSSEASQCSASHSPCGLLSMCTTAQGLLRKSSSHDCEMPVPRRLFSQEVHCCGQFPRSQSTPCLRATAADSRIPSFLGPYHEVITDMSERASSQRSVSKGWPVSTAVAQVPHLAMVDPTLGNSQLLSADPRLTRFVPASPAGSARQAVRWLRPFAGQPGPIERHCRAQGMPTTINMGSTIKDFGWGSSTSNEWSNRSGVASYTPRLSCFMPSCPSASSLPP